MAFLDLRTVIVINGIMAGLMSLVLFFQWRSYPSTVRGLDHWAAGPVTGFVSTVLFSLRGVLPDLLSVGLANVALILTGGLMLSGSCRFFKQALPRSFLPGLAVLTALPLAWLSTSDDHYPTRLLFICVVMSGVYGAHAVVMARQASQSFASRFMLVVLILLTVVVVIRAATALHYPPVGGLFAPSPIQVLYIISYSFGILLLTIGAVLMASEGLRRELEHLITHDSLTGALTRRALLDQGESELARGRRRGGSLSALMLDLDHFKLVNDTHGHRVGDMVLSDFVQRAQGQLRRPAVFGRYGGEEFVALLPDTDEAEACQVAERIRCSVTSDPALPVCQVSVGVASMQADGDETLASLIDRADAGLYRAKHLGRNRVEIGPGRVPESAMEEEPLVAGHA